MFVRAFGDDGYVVYTVKSGDTLDKIAKKYGTTYQAIAKTNMLDDPNSIEVGQELMIYTVAPAPKPKSVISASSSLPMPSNTIINYALVGGIIALSIPLAIRGIRALRERGR